jgi:hypothetical protein
MRQIFTQSAQGSSALRITADQPPFRGMASHRYVVEGFDTAQNRAVRTGGFVPRFRELSVIFETEGASNDFNPDGITMDALLAILADHLQGKLAGPTGSMGKQLALEYIEGARDVLAQESQANHFEQPSHVNYTGPFARTGTTGSL